jgi:valyl-tRNA synthetase
MNEDELPKAFEPKLVEDKWYQFWESGGYFKANEASSKPAYCIVMPPPNVTGVLHMGHALVNTLQDILIRWKRMNGFEVLWVPGTDHAGIATQTVVERQLMAKTGKRRVDFPREEFLSAVWDWKEKSQDSILHQLKKLGASCDWSRLAFTLDEERSKSVKQIFKKLFDQGLIYRGDYLVNWDPVTQTALADDEVEYEEKNSFLWHFNYPLADGNGHVTIATTRPETLLGDTAVAVSPNDDRYKAFIEKELLLPLMNRRIPIIADRHVDPTFGSGAVKVTPAHDPNDYEMGLSHNLPFITIMTPDGKINENGGKFAGMTMLAAREAVVAAMKELGLLVKTEPHKHRVGISYRSKAVIEPLLSKQWFFKMSVFKKRLREVVEEKKIALIPESWNNTYFHWIDNLRDWCISRQLWWGHRIPVWYNKENPEKVICYVGEGMPPEIANNPEAWIQEEDVLDTWFSSALWPFSVLGWPNQTGDLKKFYPNATLITGHDILFFWVARMILMGLYTMDEVPFPETFLHGLIYGKSYWKTQKDGSSSYILGEERLAYDLGKALPPGVEFKWEKMSKSKGNVIDPLEIIDSYGTDALRMALAAGTTHARQIDLDRRKFEEFKNFANKLWNGSRFVFMNLQDLTPESFGEGIDESLLTLEDRWILSLLSSTITKTNEALGSYQFDKAAMTAYEFFWKEFCAYYVEMSKPFLSGKKDPALKVNKQKLLATILCTCLRLLHPMAPFITEELFTVLKKKLGSAPYKGSDPYTKECLEALKAPACIVAPFPQVLRKEDVQLKIEEDFAVLEEIVLCLRNIRAEMQIPPSTAVSVFVVARETDPLLSMVKENKTVLEALVKIESLSFVHSVENLPFSAQKRVHSLEIIVPLPAEMKEKEKVRLQKEQIKIESQLASLEEKLSGEEFLAKAPKEVLLKLQTQQNQLKMQLEDSAKKLLELSL